ncbi:MAG: DsbA family protein [Paracoccus sp. (in: a-proteobacteria)]|nr:DsbA family protein [Paracoccus sp. (in: a-proteobacteria)]
MNFDPTRMIAAALACSFALAAPGFAQDTAPAAETEAAAPADAQREPAAGAEAEAPSEYVDDIILGDPEAPLTIIEYASFTCVHCANFHRDTFPTLKAEYIDTGLVQFIQRDVYFDAPGLWAGVLARCGGDEKFYPVAGLLLDRQAEWTSGNTAEDYANALRRLGAQTGLSQEQIDACWADQEKTERLLRTFQRNAEADNINSTPSFVINGELTSNLPWPQLKEKIDAELAELGVDPASAGN